MGLLLVPPVFFLATLWLQVKLCKDGRKTRVFFPGLWIFLGIFHGAVVRQGQDFQESPPVFALLMLYFLPHFLVFLWFLGRKSQ